MLLAVVQPAWAATDFPDGRGDTEPMTAAEQTHIDSPVQKTLEGGQFAVNCTRFEVGYFCPSRRKGKMSLSGLRFHPATLCPSTRDRHSGPPRRRCRLWISGD